MAFAGSSDFTINHSSFVDNSITNNITGNETRNQSGRVNGYQRLLNSISMDASFNSQARYPPPQCDENTRTALLGHIMEWIDSDEGDILFLDGPAGAGKSSIFQTLAGNCDERKILVGSYFFFRGSPSRNSIAPFVPTIAYHITTMARALKSLRRLMKRDHFILDKSPETQLENLILEPHQQSPFFGESGSRPILIIDGLDECNGDDDQRRIVKLIGQLADKKHAIVRCLLASRPEPQILSAVKSLSANTVARVDLNENSWHVGDDITTYFRSHFNKISSRLPSSVPRPWPSDAILRLLVKKAGQNFIYAATVIKYIDDEDSLATNQLEHVLNLSAGTAPFAELDMLYQQILMSCPLRNREVLLHIFGFVLLFNRKTFGRYYRLHPGIHLIEALYGLAPGDVTVILRRMHSILTITPNAITFLHASFGDFIFNKERSGPFFIDRDRENLFIANICIDHMGRVEFDITSLDDKARSIYDKYYKAEPVDDETGVGDEAGSMNDEAAIAPDKAIVYAWKCWLNHGLEAGSLYFAHVAMKLHQCNQSFRAKLLSNDGIQAESELQLSDGIQMLKNYDAPNPVHSTPPHIHHAIEALTRKLCAVVLGKSHITILGLFEDPGIGFFKLYHPHIVALVLEDKPPSFLYLEYHGKTLDLMQWGASSALVFLDTPRHTYQDKNEQVLVAVHCFNWLGTPETHSALHLHYAVKHWAKHIALSDNTHHALLEVLWETKLQEVKPDQQITPTDIAMVIQWLEV